MTVKSLFMTFSLFFNLISFADATTLYTEDFTGDGDVSIVGWNSIYDGGGSNGGLSSDFVWVWHNGDCENLIYTTEYTVEIPFSLSIEFQYDLRKY